jgi:hypothetical protein
MIILEVVECSGNAHRPKAIGTVVDSLPLLPTALVEISFSSGGRAVTYNVRGLEIQSYNDGSAIMSNICPY